MFTTLKELTTLELKSPYIILIELIPAVIDYSGKTPMTTATWVWPLVLVATGIIIMFEAFHKMIKKRNAVVDANETYKQKVADKVDGFIGELGQFNANVVDPNNNRGSVNRTQLKDKISGIQQNMEKFSKELREEKH